MTLWMIFGLFCCLLCQTGIADLSPNAPIVTVVSPVSTQRILPDTKDIIGVKDHHLYVIASPGEYENCSFVVTATKPLQSLLLKANPLQDKKHNVISTQQVDIKAIKCWYQDLGAGYSEKIPASHYEAITYAQIKTLVPELLLNDAGLIKVDTKKKQNYLRLSKGKTIDYALISGTHKGQGITGMLSAPVNDAKSLQPLALDSGKNQQFYVTIKIPYGTHTGIYHGHIDMLEEGAKLGELPLTLRVLPVSLPQKGHEISSIYYSMPYDREQREDLLAQTRRQLETLKRHGIDNPTLGGGSLALWNSKIVNLKDLLLAQKAVGIDITTAYFFMVGYHAEDALTPKGRQNILEIKRQAEETGVKQLYIYSHDEALAHGYDMKKMHRAMAEAGKLGVKVAGAGIPAGYARDWRAPGNVGFLGDVQNLMICLGYPIREEAENWHRLGQKIVSYGNPQHGLEQPDAYRRNYGLLLWQYGYDGACNYAEKGPWGDFFSTAYKRHVYAYSTKEGIIDTVQFEGYREGMDDVRYIKALVQTLSETSVNTSSSAYRAAKQYVDELRQGDINRDVKDSNTLRLDMICHLMALEEKDQ